MPKLSLIVVCLLTLALAACSGGDGKADSGLMAFDRPHRHAEGAPPNVILIVLDTARADRMSYNGYRRLTTPHVDAFARDGVIYRQAHSVAPWTLPSHMSMFTGLLPGQHGATWKAFASPEEADFDDVLERAIEPPSSYFLPRRLKASGYFNAGFSSNAWVARRTGFDQGFDAFYEMWLESKPYRSRFRIPSARVKMASEMAEGDAGYVLLELEEHLATHGELPEPFFLFFNFIDPHYPYSPPDLWRYGFSRDRDLGEKIARFRFSEMAMVAGARPVEIERLVPFYDAEMSYLDFVVGRLFAWLREKDYYEESLVIVTSDHGEHLGEGGRFAHQFSVEEELLHIPLVVKYPHGDQSGRVVDDPLVSNLDVYATILAAAAGGSLPEGPPTASKDLRDMDGFDRRALIAESYFSVPFLREHQERFADFAIGEHTVVRRVVFDGESRYVFEGDVFEGDGAAPGAPAWASALLNEYVKSLDGARADSTDQPLDKETLERLRSLGYAN